MKSKAKKILSLLLTLAMVLSMLPVSAFAAGEAKTYEKITSMDDLTTGEYVMAVNTGYAPTTLSGSWILAEAVAAVEDAIVGPAANLVWTITVDGATAKLTDSNGATIAPKSGNNNGIQSGDYSWAVTCTDGTFRFAGQGSDTTVLASNKGESNKFRAYKTATAAGNPGGYPADFTLYKLVGETAPENPDPNPNPDPEPTPTVVDISAALAGETGAEFTVKGVVTLVDGSNLYLQDSTGAICARMASAPADVSLGDTVIATGSRADYNGLPQLGSGTYEKSSGLTLSAKETTIDALTTADICTYVKLSDVEVTEVYDNNGAYSTPNIMVSDGTNTIQIYKAVVGKTEGAWDVKVGDVLTVSAAVSAYKTTLRLRNTLAGEIVVKQEGQPPVDPNPDPEPSATDYVLASAIAEGDKVVVYNAGNGMLVSSTASGYKLAGVAATPANAVITTEDATVVWTVGRDAASGNYTFTQDNMVLGMVKSDNHVNLSTNAGDGNTEWVLEASATANVFYLKNANMPAGSYGPYYLEYYSGYTAYSSNSPSDGQFGISFYKLGGTPPTQPEPDPDPDPEPEITYIDRMSALPVDGDTIVIYNSGNAMGSAASGKKLVGVAAEVTDNQLPLSDDMAQLLVAVDENGSYIFTMDGKYLTSAATGNGLSFADELTDCGKWTMEEAADSTWYIKNVGANYNGNYNQAMEYYNGFTTYGIKETEIYQMQLFLVSAAKSETGKITSADELVDGTYVMVVSGGYAPLVLDGSWVTVAQPTISGDEVTDAKGTVWTLDVDGSTVTLTDSNGASIKPKGGNNNGIASGNYAWSWSFDESSATFVFAGTGSDTVKLASNASEDSQYGGFHRFRGYKNTTISGNPQTYPCNFTLYRVDDTGSAPDSGLPAEGDEVVLYNLSAEGVLASENDTQSINNASAEIVDGKAVPANGGVVFTVSRNGDYYRFYNETYGYLCSNGTGNNAFYSLEASEDADWTLLDGKKGGYNLESRTAKFNGQYSQYLEYYADSYKTYSMYNSIPWPMMWP